jgi:hypothetical protein
MILSEIRVLKKSDLRYSEAIDLFVKKHGLDWDGGAHAEVYIPPGKNYIWRSWTRDPGYESFLKYVQANSSNPHLPKLLSRVREEPLEFKGIPKGVTLKFVKIEKLSALNHGDPLERLLVHGFDELTVFTKKDFPPEYKRFYDTCEDLIERGADDIDNRNVMMRGDVPVITDPCNKPLKAGGAV